MRTEEKSDTKEQQRQLHVDIVRGRNFPQSEDDPCACSTFVRLFFFDATLKETMAETFATNLQEESNAPFYNEGVDIDIPTGLDSIGLVFEVVETTRRTLPYILFYGSFIVSLAGKGRQDESIILTNINPVENPEVLAKQTTCTPEILISSPVLTIRYQVLRPKVKEEVKDVHADVVLPLKPSFSGSYSLVPKDSQYVWVSLLSDERWTEAFRYALVHEWQGRPPLLSFVGSTRKDQTQDVLESSCPRSNGSPRQVASIKSPGQTAPAVSVNTIGDVILKKWCCQRSHEVLTRLLLSAEAFGRGESSLYFTRECELSFRLQRKERTYLLKEMTRSNLAKIDSAELRDTMDSLWIYYAVGIKHDPSGSRVLTLEARRKVRDALFDEEDKMVLHSSLLNFLVPSLTLNDCNAIVAMDFKNVEPEVANECVPKVKGSTNGERNNPMAPPASELEFAMTLIDYIGPLLDTLTETELVAALKRFEPAVVNAQKRIKGGGKEEMKRVCNNLKEQERRQYNPGKGIKIAHLDILGRRKKDYKGQ